MTKWEKFPARYEETGDVPPEQRDRPTCGVSFGVTWWRYSWGVECSAMVPSKYGRDHLVTRKYAGNGSDSVSPLQCVEMFLREFPELH